MNAAEVLPGKGASPGLAVGRVCFWSGPQAYPRFAISPDMVKGELQRLDEALENSRRQLESLRASVERELGPEEAAIFSAHNLLLNDPAFYSQVEKKLIQDNVNLEAAVEDVVEEMAKIFTRIADPYMNERADDYRDVGRRVLDNLLSYQRQCVIAEGELIIMVARELLPSDTVHFHRQHVGAFVTERGGVSSHAAILARSLRLPAVVGAAGLIKAVRAGDLVVVDGDRGLIHLRPTPEQIETARRQQQSREHPAQVREARAARTRDGAEIVLAANLTREQEAVEARRQGAMGVGLLRTEFLFMDHGEFLDEESQVAAYRFVVETMAPHPVTIRTLDLGEDKQFRFETPEGETPANILGWRSLRLSLAYRQTFLAQLRAILRAGAYGPVRVLLPMVTGAEDVRQARALLRQAAAELARENLPHRPEAPVGAMIETPAAAIVPDLILREVDFVSVGTNDLVQYTMVADRLSERMQTYYRSTAPAVLALLERLAAAAAAAGKEFSICGEIAGDPLYLPLLLGLGYRSLSVAPVLLPDLAEAVERVSLAECEALARRCLGLATAAEVEDELRANLRGA